MKKLLIVLTLILCIANVCAAKITLKYASHMPASGPNTMAELVTLPFLAEITAITDGQIQFETYFNQTLLDFSHSWDGIADGAADLGWVTLWPFHERTPLFKVVDLPVFDFPTAADCAGVMWQLYAKYPEIQAEFLSQGLRPLLFLCSSPQYLFTSRPVVKLEDLKDMHLVTSSQVSVNQFRYFDTAHVYGETLYKILELHSQSSFGLVAGAEVYMLWDLQQTTPYATLAPMNGMFYTIAISEKRWQTLPAEIQEQIMRVSGYEASRRHSAAYFDYYTEALRNSNTAPTYITLTQEEWQRWAELNQPLVDEWFKAHAAEGQAAIAQKIYDNLVAQGW